MVRQDRDPGGATRSLILPLDGPDAGSTPWLQLLFFPHDQHLTAAGHRVVVDALQHHLTDWDALR